MPESRRVVDYDDLTTALNYSRNTISRTCKTHEKDFDYNRGILKGLQMSQDFADMFLKIETKHTEPQKVPVNYTGEVLG